MQPPSTLQMPSKRFIHRTARQWLWDAMGKDDKVPAKHMAACASESASERVVAFGIPRVRISSSFFVIVFVSFPSLIF